MESDRDSTIGADLLRLLDHLGIERAHFGARITGELTSILAERPEIVRSLTLIDPVQAEPRSLAALGRRLLVIAGDRGLAGDAVAKARPSLGEATLVTLEDHHGVTWSDTVAEYGGRIGAGVIEFVTAAQREAGATCLAREAAEGEFAGITYRIRGSGPALVLLPMLLAASQWEPIADTLAEHFTVVVLGGPRLGMVAMLEARGNSPGYQRMIKSVVDELRLEPGHTLLDVGCGTGALDRWLVRLTGGANPVTGVDLSPYLLGEARALTERAGLADAISYHEGNAEALPFPDRAFDATMSHTVMEECDADRMLAEMIRVTKPGGRVGVMVRAVDMTTLWNLPLPREIKRRAEQLPKGVGERGCADVSLYRRFVESPLVDLALFVHMMNTDDATGPMWIYYESSVLARLSADETREWHTAKAEAVAAGTQLFARPHHCAVGRRPG